MLRKFLYGSLIAVCVLCGQLLFAQNAAERNMASIIGGLQTGQMNWNRFYPQLKMTISQQTGGSGLYVQLANLGPVMKVALVKNIQLPGGYYYEFRTLFSSGEVDWQVASDFQGNIAGLAFFSATAQSPVQTTHGPDTSPTPALRKILRPSMGRGTHPKRLLQLMTHVRTFRCYANN